MSVDHDSINPPDKSSWGVANPTFNMLLSADGNAQGQGASFKATLTGFLLKKGTNGQYQSNQNVSSQETDVPDGQSTPLSLYQFKDLEAGDYQLTCEIEAYIPVQPTPENPNPTKQYVYSQTETVFFTIEGIQAEMGDPVVGTGGPRGGH